MRFREIEELIDELKFEDLRGPERGRINKEVRDILEMNFKAIAGLSADLFRKRIDRIIWELVCFVPFIEIEQAVRDIIAANK